MCSHSALSNFSTSWTVAIRLSCPWRFSGNNAGWVAVLFLGSPGWIFPTQGWNLGLRMQIGFFACLSHEEAQSLPWGHPWCQTELNNRLWVSIFNFMVNIILHVFRWRWMNECMHIRCVLSPSVVSPLCNSMDCTASSVHAVFRVRILEWILWPPQGSSWPGSWTQSYTLTCIDRDYYCPR